MMVSVIRSVAVLLAAAASFCSVACSNGSDRPEYAATDTDVETATEVAGGSLCATGSVRTCTIVLGTHGGVPNCVEGVDICADGAWTGCIDEATLAENPDLYGELVAE